MADSFPEDDLAAQDEVLQVMFWLRGEALAEDVSAADVARLTGGDVPIVSRILERLTARGLVAAARADIEERYSLTPAGVGEGGRRFADEFADLTKPGHGECGDPECDCRRTGSVDDCRHRA